MATEHSKGKNDAAQGAVSGSAGGSQDGAAKTSAAGPADAARDAAQSSAPQEVPHVYASPTKRVVAWVGIAYMLIATLLVTYFLARARFLNGIGPLMLCPALAGIAAVAIVRYRGGIGRGGLAACVAVTAVCGILFVLNLIVGVPALLLNWGA